MFFQKKCLFSIPIRTPKGFASCKAFGRSISASLPKPQTPFPGKGAILLGLPPQTKQGCLQSATQSHYARTHNDSSTKPLHDATAQMAVNAQMRWHKWLTTCTGATPLRPHLYNQEVYRQSEAVAKTQQPALFLIDFYYLSEFYSHTVAFAFIQ